MFSQFAATRMIYVTILIFIYFLIVKTYIAAVFVVWQITFNLIHVCITINKKNKLISFKQENENKEKNVH